MEMNGDLTTKAKMESARLKLRELTTEDAAFAYELNSDQEVVKYTGDDAFASVEEAKQFLSQYDHYRKYGFGRWGVELKETGELLGWCGLKFTAELNEYDIGFRFHKRHWNNGYATEAAKYCLEIGFKQFGMTAILGRVMKENLGSIRVLEKIGLTYFKEGYCGGNAGVIYKIEK